MVLTKRLGLSDMEKVDYWCSELVRQVGCECDYTLPSQEHGSDHAQLPNVNIEEGNRLILGNNVQISGKSRIDIKGKRNIVIICNDVRLSDSTILVQRDANIVVIGNRVLLRHVGLKISGGKSAFMMGRNATWVGGSGLCEAPERNVIVGNDCMFAQSVVLRTDDGHGIFSRTTGEQVNGPASVAVHEHVWLGNAVRVNKGAVIHRGSVLAAGSVVSGTVEPHCVYGGVPAHKIREDVTWSRTMQFEDIPELYR
ncbi:hypothetical protein D9598_19580 [Roseomonas sp. KE0001]|nr:hypothetical protein [Roseomonas sp. KE0001]